nr:zinc knuckle CX2CX4HX4C [Tanacetum cinerariifolium]
MCSIPALVKIHDILIVAFTEDGLSAMGTRLAIPKLDGNGDVLYTVKEEYEWEPPRCGMCMNKRSTSGTKKNAEMTRSETSTSNPFDALKKVESDDKICANGGISKTSYNVVNPNVATRSRGTNREKDDLNIGENKESVLADMASESDVDEVYNDTTSFMASKSGGGVGMKSLYERWKDDYDEKPYNEDKREDLTKD